MAADDAPPPPARPSPRRPEPAGSRPAGSLRQVLAAQMRARARRGAILQVFLGSVFLVGALAYALAPDRHSDTSLLWMTALLLLSTAYVALGTRTLSRLRRRARRLWVAATAAWGVLSTVLVGFLLRG